MSDENKKKKTKKPVLQFKIHKVLKEVHPDQSITASCAKVVDNILCYTCDKLCNSIKLLMKQSGKKIVTLDCMIAAVKLTMSPYEIETHANKQAQKRLNKLAINKNKKLSLSEKADLILSVSKTSRRLRNHLQGYKISGNVPVYMTSIIEYIAEEILILSGNAAREKSKHARIIERHVYLVINGDYELCQFFKNIIIPNSGVVQNIQESFLPNKKGGKYSDIQIDKKDITDTVLKNLGHKGGAKYIAKGVYDEIRNMLLNDYLHDILSNVITVVEYMKLKTITKEIVLTVLRNNGIFLMMGGGDNDTVSEVEEIELNHVGGKRKKKKGTLALMLIRRMQKRTELFIQKTSFHKLIKKITNSIKPNLQISSDALITIQYATEHYLVKLFQKAVTIAVNDKRQIINASDFKLIKAIEEF